ncbi:NAD(P)-dependent oxidoreductase [Lentzea flaviverrucosa]|uniref:3-hydroxyisobutyrate dehydrogenase n=1 Tax=Lentzea flaviverrucosa TaxID=200379 RepID=A0A1H9NVT1_9PSEU|nr:NAD(P)-binding domain-containing protein [Lentzea flaviverrucosa]RDI30078.1 3-hydroxyisobutyrate dehydrogenase-like beta-hydroxyacid dehydrogenase [Lentzea flaviverrucosa]SER39775.1 3-hydroxyisobutyrate dehydrogenase [Lentzea flaviverrucosa]
MGIKKTVSVLGLGRMGSALAKALVGQGYEVTVWNRTPKELPNTRSAATPEEAFKSDVVVTCLSTYDVQQPLLTNDIKTLVNLTSGTPDQARATARWAKDNGIEYVDGVIMAVPQQIGTPQAKIFFSGGENHHVLHAFGEPVYVGEDAGLAALYDLALLGIMWATFGGYLQAVALMGTEGIEPARFTPMVADWLNELGHMLPEMGEQTQTRQYETDVSALDINVSGLRLLTEANREQGLDTTIPQALHGLFERAQRNGHGAHSIASVIEEIRK